MPVSNCPCSRQCRTGSCASWFSRCPLDPPPGETGLHRFVVHGSRELENVYSTHKQSAQRYSPISLKFTATNNMLYQQISCSKIDIYRYVFVQSVIPLLLMHLSQPPSPPFHQPFCIYGLANYHPTEFASSNCFRRKHWG